MTIQTVEQNNIVCAIINNSRPETLLKEYAIFKIALMPFPSKQALADYVIRTIY